MSCNKKAIYPGTFDPITNGHISIIKRAKKIFNYIILAIFKNSKKNTLFKLNKRIRLAKEATKNITNIKVIGFNTLTTKFAKKRKIKIIIRGIRSIIDFENELHHFNINYQIEPTLEYVYFISKPKYNFISSSCIKEMAEYDGNIKKFLPLPSYNALKKKFIRK